MTYKESVHFLDKNLNTFITALFGLTDYTTTMINAHDGGRNIVFNCQKEGSTPKIIRVSYLNDRKLEDYLGELEYVRYLFDGGAPVSNVITSQKGNLVEEIHHENHTFYLSIFEKAKGKLFYENHYRYRDGVPITEYYYNCGNVLGKMHQLSKEYKPTHVRYHFSDKYNEEYIYKLIPSSLPILKDKIISLLHTLKGFDRDKESYGLVHFDFNDGNYMIDFETGELTVYDFDNACYCWYMFDLASLWRNGLGWVQFEEDVEKRKKFMEDYFNCVIEGYRFETIIDEETLKQLPLFLQVNLMENIVDHFEVCYNNGNQVDFDEELSYLIKCMEDDILYFGFFHEIYKSKEPFTYSN